MYLKFILKHINIYILTYILEVAKNYYYNSSRMYPNTPLNLHPHAHTHTCTHTHTHTHVRAHSHAHTRTHTHTMICTKGLHKAENHHFHRFKDFSWSTESVGVAFAAKNGPSSDGDLYKYRGSVAVKSMGNGEVGQNCDFKSPSSKPVGGGRERERKRGHCQCLDHL